MTEEQELKAIGAFVEKMMSSEDLKGPEGMKTALENLRHGQRLELSLRTEKATELMRRVRADMAANLVTGMEEPLKERVKQAIAFGDFEIRAQMYIEFFRNIPQLPQAMVLQVGALAARGKELYIELSKYLPDDEELAEQFRDIIEYYETEARNASKIKH